MHPVSLPAPARQTRTQYRHELRSLIYVTLDDANGGIIRNLNRYGATVQAVGRLRHEQRVRLRFELRFPRLRVETYGRVAWSNPSGQCGIRFEELPAITGHQINQWIFCSLLDALARHSDHPHSIFGASVVSIASRGNVGDENSLRDDGLNVSIAPRPAIRLKRIAEELEVPHHYTEAGLPALERALPAQTDWLARRLSGSNLAWLVDGLVVVAGLLLFGLIFLSIAHELPQWPLLPGAASIAAVFVGAGYWTLFTIFGGASLGARVARAAAADLDEQEGAGRFR